MNLKEFGIEKDKNDILKSFKSRFVNNPNEIYLDGNSLGKLPKTSYSEISELVKNQWGSKLISSWNDHWLKLSEDINLKMSNLINSKPEEVLVGESTSVNLYKIIYALLVSNLFKKNLVSDCLNFPSDIYVLDGLKHLTDENKLTILDYPDEINCNYEILKKSIKNNPGIYCLSLVSYKSSFLYSMKELNEIADKNQSIIVWDCSHAIGVTEIDVKKSKIKIAIGCTYKFLNGGPGSPSFLFVSEKIIDKIINPVQGWFGHQNPFNFDHKYIPSKNITKFNAGTPSILSLFPVKHGLDITLEAGITNIRNKSIELGEYLIKLIKKELIDFKVEIASPENSDSRGSHVTIQHDEAWRICKILIKGDKNRKKIIPDFRPKNNIRLGFSPLYTSFTDLYETIMIIKSILINKEFLLIDESKNMVT